MLIGTCSHTIQPPSPPSPSAPGISALYGRPDHGSSTLHLDAYLFLLAPEPVQTSPTWCRHRLQEVFLALRFQRTPRCRSSVFIGGPSLATIADLMMASCLVGVVPNIWFKVPPLLVGTASSYEHKDNTVWSDRLTC